MDASLIHLESDELLRPHVAGVDACNRNRLFHRVATERFTQFLVQDNLDERGDVAFHLLVYSSVQHGSVRSSIECACTPFTPQPLAISA